MADIFPNMDRILNDSTNWREARDRVVMAAINAMAQSGAAFDFLAMQGALGAAFGAAAQHRAELYGCDNAWSVLSQWQSRMEQP